MRPRRRHRFPRDRDKGLGQIASAEPLEDGLAAEFDRVEGREALEVIRDKVRPQFDDLQTGLATEASHQRWNAAVVVRPEADLCPFLRVQAEQEPPGEAIAEHPVEHGKRRVAARDEMGHGAAVGQRAGEIRDCLARIVYVFQDGSREDHVEFARQSRFAHVSHDHLLIRAGGT
jgi:hypothetical protein